MINFYCRRTDGVSGSTYSCARLATRDGGNGIGFRSRLGDGVRNSHGGHDGNNDSDDGSELHFDGFVGLVYGLVEGI